MAQFLQNGQTSNIIEKYDLPTAIEHMLAKEMWGGSAKLVNQTLYVMNYIPSFKDGKIEGYDWVATKEAIIISDRAMKCFDEVITNTADQFQRTSTLLQPHKMTTIVINFDVQTGRCIVSNDGDGFDVEIHPKHPQQLYIPQIITTELLRGSNFIKELGSTTAGTNGVGVKLTNAHSLEFILDTYDINRQKHYRQVCLNHIETINPPEITSNTIKYGDPKFSPHTTVNFLLDYAAVGWGSIDYKDPNDRKLDKPHYLKRQCNITKENLIQLEKVIRMRVCHMAVFLGDKCSIYFNNALVPFNNLEKLAKIMYPSKTMFQGKVKLFKPIPPAEKKKLPKDFKRQDEPLAEWEVIIVLPLETTEQFSIINGVIVSAGPHFDQIKEEIHSIAKSKITDLFPDDLKGYHGQMLNMLGIMIVGNIPDVQWGGGQLKTSISNDRAFFKDIEIDPKLIKNVCNALYDRMLLSKGQPRKSHSSIRIREDKYERANKLGPNSVLMITEGDSADSFAQTGRRNAECNLGTDRFGSFIIGGVPINARKEVEFRNIDGKTLILLKKSLINNIIFNELIKILNIDIDKKYETDQEFATLNYGQIWYIVDEDLDGRGCIFGLCLNMFHLFWSALIKRQFIKRLRTPVVRLFPTLRTPQHLNKKLVREFFNEEESKKFLDEIGAAADTYDIYYYKGVGRHELNEKIQIFKNIQKNLITIVPDNNATQTLNTYYADDTKLRKTEFSTPTRNLTDPEHQLLNNHQLMTCSTQIQVYTKEYKMDNLIRKLPSVDGFIITRRRVFAGAIKKFGYSGENKFIKVFQFGGFIAENMFYHHGDQSLYKCIIKMTQYIPGGQLIPLLIGGGNFGTLLKGGKDAASARYIDVKINRPIVEVVFPHKDEKLYEFLVEDGKISIPKFYMPIVPLVLFKYEKIPADGWNYITWARDVKATITAIKTLIYNPSAKIYLPPATTHFTCKFIKYENEEYAIGDYKIVGDAIEINCLPPRVWSHTYVNAFKKVEEIKEGKKIIKNRIDEYADEFKDIFVGNGPENRCYENTVKIIFRLKPGGLEKIKSLKPTIFNFDENDEDEEPKPTEEEDEPQPKPVENNNWHNLGDPIQQFLGLVIRMKKNLNMLDINGAVKEYNSYEDVLLDWFPIRKNFYIKRITRDIIILQIKIRYYQEILRFYQEYNNIGLGKQLKEAEMINILSSNNFLQVNNKIINDFGYEYENPTNKLIELAFQINVSYNYLLGLSTLDRSEENKVRLQSKINNYQNELNVILEECNKDPFYGASQWIRDLNNFEKIYDLGIATDWKYSIDNFQYS